MGFLSFLPVLKKGKKCSVVVGLGWCSTTSCGLDRKMCFTIRIGIQPSILMACQKLGVLPAEERAAELLGQLGPLGIYAKNHAKI